MDPTSISTSLTIGNEKSANLLINDLSLSASFGTKFAIAVNNLFHTTGAVPKKVSTFLIPKKEIRD